MYRNLYTKDIISGAAGMTTDSPVKCHTFIVMFDGCDTITRARTNAPWAGGTNRRVPVSR
jgi:hypothetical protein